MQFDGTVTVNGPCLVGRELEVVFAEGFIGQFFHFVLAAGCSAQYLGCIGSLRFYGVEQYHGTVFPLDHFGRGSFMFQIMQAVFEPASVEPVIVVREGTESIQFRTVTVGNDCFATIIQIIDRTAFIVECDIEVISFDRREACVRLFFERQFSC